MDGAPSRTPKAPGTENRVPVHPVFEILRNYTPLRSGEITAIPYTLNLMAMDLLKLKKSAKVPQVKRYMEWYLAHLNYPDRYGFTGSIYDYTITADGKETSMGRCDSIDSYAATFIMLVERYLSVTGDRAFIEANRRKLEDIMYLVPALQDSDGLTFPMPAVPFKYLMDNCEAYGGFRAFEHLAQTMHWESHAYYKERREGLYHAIQTLFIDPNNGNYFWSIEKNAKTASSWTVFYPDSYAQLFPILYGQAPNALQRLKLWKTFHTHHQRKIKKIPVEQQIIYRWTKEIMENTK